MKVEAFRKGWIELKIRKAQRNTVDDLVKLNIANIFYIFKWESY